MSDQTFTLDEAREAYRRVSARASVAAQLICELRTKRIWVDHQKTQGVIANICWSHMADEYWSQSEEPGGGPSMTPMECLQERIAEGEVEPLNIDKEVNGQAAAVFRPFFAEDKIPFSTELGLSYLNPFGDRTEQFLGLSEGVRPLGQSTTGLSEWETDLLTLGICTRSLTLVNYLRNLQTALRYVKTSRSREYQTCSPKYVLAEDDGIDALVARLDETVTLGLRPTPEWCFGTTADKVNPLPALPREVLELPYI